jgi:ABC-type transport system involved in multi-copper enzyme maturation permease subunit
MLWHKAWIETRWRFWIGLALLLCSAATSVLAYPQIVRLLPLGSRLEIGGELGRRVAEAIELSRTYRGYVWSHWFVQNLSQTFSLFAVLLGAGGLVSSPVHGAALFTLSLPVSRERIVAARAAAGLGELLGLAFLPSLLVPLLSPAIGERYPFGDALAHAACVFVAGTTLYSLTLLLSTLFGDVWRPVLLGVGAAIALAAAERLTPALSDYGVFATMTGETYFRGNGLPWLGMLACAAASAALTYGAAHSLARRDF